MYDDATTGPEAASYICTVSDDDTICQLHTQVVRATGLSNDLEVDAN